MKSIPLDFTRALLFIWKLALTLLPFLFLRLSGRPVSPEEFGARLRRTFQELGLTYIKLGQFLAMRFDILPEAICHELAGLFDAVPPMPVEVVRQTIESEFAGPVEETFRSFEWDCIAAASIAQVHKAVTVNGEVVAVKIQRPGIAELFAADIRNVRRIARIADSLRLLGQQSLVEAVNEFERFTAREMNFLVEAQTAEKLRDNAGPFELVPRVHWSLTTSRILTMDFVDGRPLSEIIQLVKNGRLAELEESALGLDLQQSLHNFAYACMRQLFVTGFFHADPHPGNILLCKGGVVAFVDFGIFGQLTPERREVFASYIENIALGDIEQSYRHFIHLMQPTTETDLKRLRYVVHDIMYRWHKASVNADTPLAERHLGTYFGEFIDVIRTNHVLMNLDTLLFWRALLALDATALHFQEQINLLKALADFFKETRPSAVERFVGVCKDRRYGMQLVEFGQAAPRQLDWLLDDLAHQRGSIDVQHGLAAPAVRSHNRQTHLLALAIGCVSLAVVWARAPVPAIGRMMALAALIGLLAAIIFKWVRD